MNDEKINCGNSRFVTQDDIKDTSVDKVLSATDGCVGDTSHPVDQSEQTLPKYEFDRVPSIDECTERGMALVNTPDLYFTRATEHNPIPESTKEQSQEALKDPKFCERMENVKSTFEDYDVTATGLAKKDDPKVKQFSAAVESIDKNPIENFDEYANIVNQQARKNYLTRLVDEKKKDILDMSKIAFRGTEDADFIMDKLNEVPSLDELNKRLATDEGVDYFFTDPDTGEVVQVSDDIKEKRKMEFKRGYLILCYQNNQAIKDIETAQAECDKAIQEFNSDVTDAMRVLSDNALTYCSWVKDSVDPSRPDYNTLMTDVKWIESAYTMEVLNETLDKYPSIIKHTLDDIKVDGRVRDIGKRYHAKLASSGLTSSLVPFMNDDVKESLEYRILTPQQYVPGQENLFIFSLIRFFAHESWTGTSRAKKLHSSFIIMLQKLMTGKMDESVKEMVTTNIAKYLARFN